MSQLIGIFGEAIDGCHSEASVDVARLWLGADVRAATVGYMFRPAPVVFAAATRVDVVRQQADVAAFRASRVDIVRIWTVSVVRTTHVDIVTVVRVAAVDVN